MIPIPSQGGRTIWVRAHTRGGKLLIGGVIAAIVVGIIMASRSGGDPNPGPTPTPAPAATTTPG